MVYQKDRTNRSFLRMENVFLYVKTSRMDCVASNHAASDHAASNHAASDHAASDHATSDHAASDHIAE